MIDRVFDLCSTKQAPQEKRQSTPRTSKPFHFLRGTTGGDNLASIPWRGGALA